MNCVECVSEKKTLFTESKTEQYFPRNRQPMIAFRHVLKKQLDGRNEVGWKALRSSPQWHHNSLLSQLSHGFDETVSISFKRSIVDDVVECGMSRWELLIVHEWMRSRLHSHVWRPDVTGGSSFLSELRNLNEPFSGLSVDFGSYLEKYRSVFDAVKRIFFSETCSTRLIGAEFPANYPFNSRKHH